MANILDEQERKRKELAAQGIHTRGVAGAKGGPAEMTYKPLEQRTGAEAKALGVSPQMQGQIAQEQGLIPPAALPTPAVTPSQAPAPQARGMSPQAQGVIPQAQAANQQLETAREGIGSGRAASNRRLLEKAMQVSPEIRKSAKDRMEWRTMTPEQRRNRIGEKKLEQEAIQVKDRIGKTTSWEQMADATGTNLDSYGNSEQFYTPDQILYKRQAQREFDKEWADVLSNVDRSAFSSPQEIYQLQEQMPSVQKYGDFLGSYRFNVIRKYATPQMRAQMDAEDRNQKMFRDWMVSRGAEEIEKAQEQNGGFRFTNDGTGDIATQIALNRDKDLASGQIWRQFLAETPQIYTAMDGSVKVDPAQEGRFKQAQAQRKAESDANAKEEELRALEAYEDQRYAVIQQMNPERAAMMIKNPITRKYDDFSQYAPEPPKEEKPIPPGTRWTDEKKRKEHQESLVVTQNLHQFAEQFPGMKTTQDLEEQIAAWEEMRGEPDAATKYPGLPQDEFEFDSMVEKIRQNFDAVQKAGGLDGIRNRLARMQSISWDEEEE